jgi:hypothetical protein
VRKPYDIYAFGSDVFSSLMATAIHSRAICIRALRVKPGQQTQQPGQTPGKQTQQPSQMPTEGPEKS